MNTRACIWEPHMFRRTIWQSLWPLLHCPSRRPDASVNPSDFIDAFRALSGEHKGISKGHAKGVCAKGEFMPSAGRVYFTGLFLSQAIPALRFSMAGGNPWSPTIRAPRGLGRPVAALPDGGHNVPPWAPPYLAPKSRAFWAVASQRPDSSEAERCCCRISISGCTGLHVRKLEWLAIILRRGATPDDHLPRPAPFYLQNRQGEEIKVGGVKPQDGEEVLTRREIANTPADFYRGASMNGCSRAPFI